MKKIILIISLIIVSAIAALAAITAAYSKTDDYRSNVLPQNTAVNGIDCSGLTYDQAAVKLTDTWNERHMIITGSLNETLAEYTDFGCKYDIIKDISKIKHRYLVFAAVNHYLHTPISSKVTMKISDYGQDFKQQVVSSEFLNNPDATESKDAYVDLSDENFPIVPEVLGTMVDKEKFFDAVLHHIQGGDMQLLYNERDYHLTPKVSADDESLKKYQEFCRKYLKQKITYEMGDETFTIPVEQLSTLFADDLSGEADDEATRLYAQQLADTYDNVGAERSFTTLAGKEITVKGGTYGWEIDTEKEARQLAADVSSHKDVSRKPVYSFESYGTYTRTMGDTYIDVDLTKQCIKFFRDGEEKFSCSVVTGDKNDGRSTPQGTYYVLNKLRNVTMRGTNNDGSRYEVPALYWMGVTWNGIGIHDSNWRTKFGGNIWISNGSHGCINMPKWRIPELYKMVEVNMPVVMHY